MTAQTFEKETQGESAGALQSSQSSADTASMRTLTQPIDDESDWPESKRAWACLLGCFFLMFNSWGLVNAFGTWSSYYVGHSLRHTDQLQLNLIGSTQSCLVLLMSNPIGRILDAGNSRKVIGCGTILVPLGLFVLSIVHPNDVEAFSRFLPIWATQGVITGTGMGFFFVTSSQGKL